MKTKFFLAFLGFLLFGNILFALTIEEVERLQKMGFTNEQIVEMNKGSSSKTDTPSKESENQVSITTINTINKLKADNKGLLVICVSKEWPEKGPGFIDVWAGTDGKKKEKIGKADIKEYALEGQKGNTTFEHIEFNNQFLNDVTVADTPDIVTSRYYADFPLVSGNYEVSLQRFFHVRKTAFGNTGADRHKLFHDVKIIPGKATVISYFWKANAEFGLDTVMSKNHNKMTEYVAQKFGPFLSEIKVQHNK